jgi:rRNA maturation endonuclease Nob1
MRPNCQEHESEMYECPGCGARAEAPETRTCGECGEALIHIGRSRDL